MKSNPILFIIVLILIFSQSLLLAQPEGYSKEVIVENKIGKLIGRLVMPDTSHELNGVIIREYEFDKSGNCRRKKSIYPLRDVVTTSAEYILEYDINQRVISEIKISGSEPLTQKDENFIAMFGSDKDTIITKFIFEEEKVVRRERFNISRSDTITQLYVYEDSLLARVDQYSMNYKDELNRRNYQIRYFYDSKGRKIREEKQYQTADVFSVKEFEYRSDSDQLSKESSYNGIIWTTYRDGYGGKKYELEQDSLRGRIIEYKYNEDDVLIKEEVYPNLADMNQVRIIEIENFDPNVKRRVLSGDEQGAIMLKDEDIKTYDSNGLLVQETILLRGKLLYICKYEVVN